LKSAIAAADNAGSATLQQTTTPRQSWFGCLRVRNFRLYASGQVISFTGSWVQRITQDWLVLTLTGSVTAVGITVALQQLPTLLFGLLGGVIADRHPRRRVLQVTQGTMVATSGVLGYLALTHQVTAWHVYVLAFVLGVAIALDNPARQAFVNEMVGPDLLRSAIGLNSAIFQLGALIGPAISGLLIGPVGTGLSVRHERRLRTGPDRDAGTDAGARADPDSGCQRRSTAADRGAALCREPPRHAVADRPRRRLWNVHR
jgi:nitrate/nitrite transporter NarK